MGYYKPMACGKGGYPAVLDEGECQAMENALPRCQSMIQACYDSESVWSCVPASIYCNNAMIGPYQKTGQNVYDIRGQCEDSNNLCYSALGWISEFLNKADVQKELGVEVSNYDSCNFDINRNFLFQGDWMQPFHRLVPGILEQIPVLIYAGDADSSATGSVTKPGPRHLSGQDRRTSTRPISRTSSLTVDKYGKIKNSGNFTFLQIFGAGHMVPMDEPEASLDFLNRWVGGEWF